MSDTTRIFDQIRRSELNAWVGGMDPETIGDACVRVLDRYLTFDPGSTVLDFGCGVGRVLLSLLKHRPDISRITGFDILPQAIAFCDAHIAAAFPQAGFELIQGRNAHYDRLIGMADARTMADAQPARSHAQLQTDHAASFTDVYAFSVFTHVELADFRSLLTLLASLLKPGGTLLFTVFLLTAFSRYRIQQRSTMSAFAQPATEAGGSVFIGNAADRLAFIAFDAALVEQLVFEAGLMITHVEYGAWASGSVFFSPSMQDVVVCRRPIASSPG